MSRRIQSTWDQIAAATRKIQKEASVFCPITEATETTENTDKESPYDGSFFVYESDGTKRKVEQAHGAFADDVEKI